MANLGRGDAAAIASPSLAPEQGASLEAQVGLSLEPLGFSIQLPSAQLGDLIQINCMNRVRGAFRVTSGSREGYLFFDAGQLVHAELGSVTGLDAVVQMLGLRGGAIDPCTVPWPTLSTIDMGADALLLRAAQRIDEQPLQPADGNENLTTKVVRRVSLPAAAAPDLDPVASQVSRLEVAQLAFDGTIQSLKGGACADLADTAFFCHRMAEALGDGLGLGACRAAALEGKDDGIVVFKGRSIVGTRGKLADLEFVLCKVALE